MQSRDYLAGVFSGGDMEAVNTADQRVVGAEGIEPTTFAL